jgi:hypothetical protein
MCSADHSLGADSGVERRFDPSEAIFVQLDIALQHSAPAPVAWLEDRWREES